MAKHSMGCTAAEVTLQNHEETLENVSFELLILKRSLIDFSKNSWTISIRIVLQTYSWIKTVVIRDGGFPASSVQKSSR